MNPLWQDLRYAVRSLAQSRGFTCVAVLTLALGIGANTAIFSVVDAVLLKTLPFPEPERLVRVEDRHMGVSSNGGPLQLDGSTSFTYANFADLAERSHTLEKAAAYRPWLFTLSGEGEPENVDGYRVSAEFFSALGVSPELGRTFSADENQHGNGAVVVLSHGLWKRRFGSDRGVIGKTCKVNGVLSQVIGVMPSDFRLQEDASLWMPLDLDDSLRTNRRAHIYTVIARLKPGVTLGQARADAESLSAEIDAENNSVDPGWNAYVSPFQEQLVAGVKLPILVLFCAAGFVLLIACANVANLLLARAAVRAKEIGVRVALGASKARILSQLLTESVLLAGLGAMIGVLFATYGLRMMVQLNPSDIPRLQDAEIDWRVLIFTLVVTCATAVLFGLAPALEAFRVDLQQSLRETRRSSANAARSRLRSMLVVSEIALALILLTGAGLLTNSFIRLLQVPLGLNPKNVLTAQLFLPAATERSSDRRSIQTINAVLEKVRTVPGVRAAGLVNCLPIEGGVSTDFTIVGRPPLKSGDEPSADIRIIDPGYLRTLQIPLLRGRDFSERDSADAPRVMIINQTMANTFWPGQDPIGHRVTMKDWGPDLTGEIVGVVGDVKPNGPEVPVDSMIYWPYPQFPSLFNYLVVRSAGDPSAVLAGIKAQVRSVNPDQPVSNVRTMEQVLGESLAQRRFSMTLTGLFAAISLLLAAVGVASVMAFMVSQRTQEMGIRMALGAQRNDLFALVLRQGLRLTAFGLAIGLGGALALTRLLSGMLFGVRAGDPLTYVLVSSLLVAVAAIACYLPARTATRVDPIVALRYE
jgi:putative ABC transport system permease protein